MIFSNDLEETLERLLRSDPYPITITDSFASSLCDKLSENQKLRLFSYALTHNLHETVCKLFLGMIPVKGSLQSIFDQSPRTQQLFMKMCKQTKYLKHVCLNFADFVLVVYHGIKFLQEDEIMVMFSNIRSFDMTKKVPCLEKLVICCLKRGYKRFLDQMRKIDGFFNVWDSSLSTGFMNMMNISTLGPERLCYLYRQLKFKIICKQIVGGCIGYEQHSGIHLETLIWTLFDYRCTLQDPVKNTSFSTCLSDENKMEIRKKAYDIYMDCMNMNSLPIELKNHVFTFL